MKQLNLYYLGGGGVNPDIPDGKTVTPINDIEIWQKCAGLTPVYNSLGAVLADSGYIAALMSDDNAVDYLVRSTEWATAQALVPTMTSNTEPSGEAIYSYQYDTETHNYYAYHAFNPDTYCWNNYTQNPLFPAYIGYKFESPTIVQKVTIAQGSTLNRAVKAFKIQGSNDNSAWVDLTDTLENAQNSINSFEFTNTTEYQYYRIYITSNWGASGEIEVNNLQFYSVSIPSSQTAMQYIGASDYASHAVIANDTWLDAVCTSEYWDYIFNNSAIPLMTSNTTPEGVVTRSSVYNNTATYEAYKAFDRDNSSAYGWVPNGSDTVPYIRYEFVNPTCVNMIEAFIISTESTKYYGCEISGSNDGTSYTVLGYINIHLDKVNHSCASINKDDNYYKYYKISYIEKGGAVGGWTAGGGLKAQLYNRVNAGIQTWLTAAGLEKNYVSLSQILNDTATLSTLMASEDAVDYLVTVKSWISAIVSSEAAMTAIGNSNYASNTLLDDNDWCNGICNSEYFESVLNVKVPQMTSNTLPEGSVTASSTTGSGTGVYTTGSDYYWAFDRNDSTYVGNKGENTSGFRITYEFPSEVTIYKSSMNAHTYLNAGTFEMHLQHYNETSSVWLDDATAFNIIANTTYTKNYTAPVTATKFSLYSPTLKTENHSLYIRDLQFYGRQDV